ncbi:hypothetical protein BO221_01470 [Archangium sp. Cb G35]|uniref:hypothetical protein n=1 Tax=Archangium sp. Cb G35 TaxID=1920190 RepID=UPI000935B22A|nr:hypothetical protein [Archangium sp. Cb G35]OJT26726.1 hypothetical protein BO221_01470 [Archangium sp. Cb G35]
MAQDQDKGKLQASEDQEKLNPKKDDVSGQGRERRDDEEFPKHRNAGEFGTHGGPNKPGKEDTRKIHAPGSSKAGSQ